MSLPGFYFDALYDDADGPWSMRSRWYERRKYALTTAVLPVRATPTRWRSAARWGN